MKRILALLLIVMLVFSMAGCGNSICASISLDKASVTLTEPNQTIGLNVTKTPADATEQVYFNSSDPSVATVDRHGLITAVGEGATTIMVTCGDAAAFCEVVVTSSGTNTPVDDTHEDPVETQPTEPETQPTELETVECSRCDGNGSYTCNLCNGDYNCKDCGGTGEDPNADPTCTICMGDGLCGSCSGDGKQRGGKKCLTCYGSGDCSYCKGTGDLHYSKNGIWSLVCHSCAGHRVCQKCVEGTIKCDNCGGTGKRIITPMPPKPDPIPCGACGGRQVNLCAKCGGLGSCPNNKCTLGYEYCSRCGGSGDCTSCSGLKKNSAGKTCSTCKGDGDCTKCDGDKKFKCSTCNGTKICPSCNASPWCTTCGGTGYV